MVPTTVPPVTVVELPTLILPLPWDSVPPVFVTLAFRLTVPLLVTEIVVELLSVPLTLSVPPLTTTAVLPAKELVPLFDNPLSVSVWFIVKLARLLVELIVSELTVRLDSLSVGALWLPAKVPKTRS